jgi:hypothetical protein
MKEKWYTIYKPDVRRVPMSDAAPNIEYSGYTFPFESPEEAGLVEHNNLFKTPVAAALESAGVVKIESPLTADDYAEVATSFRTCQAECPEALKATWHIVDRRFGNDAGFVRKERRVRDGIQVQDAKNYFHFNEQARKRWADEFRLAPSELRKFLELGYEVHDTLLQVARTAVVDQLEPTHPRITQAVFPKGSESVSFYRHLDYDDYEIDPSTIDVPVATPHLDLSWLSLQGNATAPGFYGVDQAGNKVYYDDHDAAAYAFMGISHRKMYGRGSFILPLRHGVDRVVIPGATHMPRRNADVLFLDPWKIDCRNTAAETKGY